MHQDDIGIDNIGLDINPFKTEFTLNFIIDVSATVIIMITFVIILIRHVRFWNFWSGFNVVSI